MSATPPIPADLRAKTPPDVQAAITALVARQERAGGRGEASVASGPLSISDKR